MKQIDLIIDALSVAESSVWSDKITEALAAARELQALKPVAWMLPDYGDVLPASEADGTGIYNIPLYTAPPRKPWVGLTDDEIKKIMQRWRNGYIDIKDVEQLLKDKNT
jgi:hypothetical protein